MASDGARPCPVSSSVVPVWDWVGYRLKEICTHQVMSAMVVSFMLLEPLSKGVVGKAYIHVATL